MRKQSEQRNSCGRSSLEGHAESREVFLCGFFFKILSLFKYY